MALRPRFSPGVPFRNLLSAILPYEMGRLSSRAYVLIRLCAAEVSGSRSSSPWRRS
jgi:hypothetical protein